MSPVRIIIIILIIIIAVCNPRKRFMLRDRRKRPNIRSITKFFENESETLTNVCTKLIINRTQDGDIATNIKCANLSGSQCKCSGDTPYLHLHKDNRTCLTGKEILRFSKINK